MTKLKLIYIFKNKEILFPILLIIVAVISHLQWFNPFSTLTFGDWQFRPDAHVAQLLNSWNTWITFMDIGSTNVLVSGFPFRGILWSFIVNIGFSYDIATKLTLFIPVALGSFLSPYLLARYWTKDAFIGFCAALFYGSTTYLLVIETAHIPIGFVYAMLPILVLMLDVCLRRNKASSWVLLALLFSLGVYYEVRIMLSYPLF